MANVKPIIGCDIDGVLYPFIVAARLYFHMRGFDVEVAADADTHWDKLQEQVPPDAWDTMWKTGRKEVFDSAAAYPGSIAALHQLEQLADIKFVTNRPRSIAHVTLNWLGKHKLNPWMVIHSPGAKSGYAQDCDLFIEDRTDNALEVAANSQATVFLPRRPWNTGDNAITECDRIRYFDDWGEVVSWVKLRARTS